MTYKESYMKCDTLEELEAEMNNDIVTAKLINPDRVKVIVEAAKEVSNVKFVQSS